MEADLAMYEAKEAGRDRYAVAEGRRPPTGAWARASPGPTGSATRSTRTASSCTRSRSSTSRRAGSASTSCCCACSTRDGELIPPGAFLPVAERYDLIGEIDRWVVRRAIAMLAEAGAAGHARSPSRSTCPAARSATRSCSR